MKIAKSLGLLTAVVMGLGSVPTAEAVVNIQNVGTGARSTALGNSFVAVADNADAVFENPAGVTQLSKRQVVYTNVSLFYGGIDGDDLGQHVVSYAQSLGSKLGVGIGYERIGSELMSENGAFVSLAYKVTPDFSLGLNGKYLFWSVGSIPNDPVSGRADPLSNSSNGAVGIDVGLLWKTPFWGAQLGVMAKNVNEPNVAKGSVAGDSKAGQLPMDLAVGVAYRVQEQTLVSLQWAMRDLTGEEIDNRLILGGEMQLLEGLMLRAGGSKLFQDDASGDLSAGLGYRWNNVLFDYGYHIPLDLIETNGAHRFSFAYEF